MLAEVPESVLEALTEAAAEIADGDAALAQNHLFAGLYGVELGYYRNMPDNRAEWRWETGAHAWTSLPDGSWVRGKGWVRRRRRMRRREWIERHVLIKGTAGAMEPLILNHAQRRLEAQILKMERAGLPVRIVILKARQIGFSTYIQAVIFEMLLRRVRAYALLVAHRRDTAKKILRKVHVMRESLLRDVETGERWNFKTRSRAKEELEFESPQQGSIGVDSSESESPGHGETVDILHMTETSRWKNAEETAKGAEIICSDEPGTYAFDETTAAGDWGYFRDKFWLHWSGDGSPEVREHDPDMIAWVSMFVPWFENPKYRLTYTRRWTELPEGMAERVLGAMDPDEKRAFGQVYYQRRYGWRTVDADQIAWYQLLLKSKCGGRRDTRAEQYPSFPADAFLATGRPAFTRGRLSDLIAAARDPEWRGDLLDYAGSMTPEQREALDVALKR